MSMIAVQLCCTLALLQASTGKTAVAAQPGGKPSIAEVWQKLAALPPQVSESGYLVSFERGGEMNEMLAATEKDAEVLETLWAHDVDPKEVVYQCVTTASREQLAKLGLEPEGTEYLERTREWLEVGADQNAHHLAECELWFGVGGDFESPSSLATTLTLLVAVHEDGTRSLILGLVGQAIGEHNVTEPELVYGSWLYKAHGTRDITELNEDRSGASMEPVAASAVGKGKLKKKVKDFGKCFKDCVWTAAPVMTFFQVGCVVLAVVGCTGTGPVYAACVYTAAAICGVANFALGILPCALMCL